MVRLIREYLHTIDLVFRVFLLKNSLNTDENFNNIIDTIQSALRIGVKNWVVSIYDHTYNQKAYICKIKDRIPDADNVEVYFFYRGLSNA